jgi:hypothetical protein
MPRKRSRAPAAKTGRTWSPLKRLTITERGPLQFQARIRRTGRGGQVKDFETRSCPSAISTGLRRRLLSIGVGIQPRSRWRTSLPGLRSQVNAD